MGGDMKAWVEKRGYYIVQKGDTWEKIAEMFACSESTIKFYNQTEVLSEGDILFLQKNENCYVVKPLDSVEKICAQTGLTKTELQTKTGCSKFFIGQKIYY